LLGIRLQNLRDFLDAGCQDVPVPDHGHLALEELLCSRLNPANRPLHLNPKGVPGRRPRDNVGGPSRVELDGLISTFALNRSLRGPLVRIRTSGAPSSHQSEEALRLTSHRSYPSQRFTVEWLTCHSAVNSSLLFSSFASWTSSVSQRGSRSPTTRMGSGRAFPNESVTLAVLLHLASFKRGDPTAIFPIRDRAFLGSG